jgi:tRNA dimethylallyltransferase
VKRLLVVLGPTGVGKTDIAFEVARRLHGEIISADSRLLYRMMDIGTAKPDASMRREIPHHMMDLAPPGRQFSAKDYEREARLAVKEVLGRGRVPIVVGGTGLYIRALLRGIFDGPAADKALRDTLRDEARRTGPAALWRKLNGVDPEKARNIDPANIVRVIRALEVYALAGRPMSGLEKEAKPIDVPSVKIGLRRSRPDLAERIDRRVDRMIANGFVGEVRTLVAAGYGDSRVVRSTLGYKEVLLHLEGTLALEDAIALIKRNTRRFAKRQMTWFAREPDVDWINITDLAEAEVVDRMCSKYETRTHSDLSQ